MTIAITKLTPNLLVDSIEEVLPFWTRLGFAVTVSVPEGEHLGFAILAHGDVELMLQSRASMAKDLPPLADAHHTSMLYLEVPDLAPLRAALTSVPTVVPERTTFYGARELIVRDPAGNVIAFAHHA